MCCNLNSCFLTLSGEPSSKSSSMLSNCSSMLSTMSNILLGFLLGLVIPCTNSSWMEDCLFANSSDIIGPLVSVLAITFASCSNVIIALSLVAAGDSSWFTISTWFSASGLFSSNGLCSFCCSWSSQDGAFWSWWRTRSSAFSSRLLVFSSIWSKSWCKFTSSDLLCFRSVGWSSIKLSTSPLNSPVKFCLFVKSISCGSSSCILMIDCLYFNVSSSSSPSNPTILAYGLIISCFCSVASSFLLEYLSFIGLEWYFSSSVALDS